MRGPLVLMALALVALSSAAAADSVAGTASYRERIALPPGAVFEAVLEDVSLADAPAVEIGRTAIADPGNPPFAFAIDFDPAEIQAEHTYSVRTQVSVGRKLIFVSDKLNPVLTRGAPSEVEIWMIKVGDTAQEAQAAPAQIGAHGLRLPASFGGDLPCPDCEALRYRLNLWSDQVFHMRRTWEGTDRQRDTIGRWAVDPDSRVLMLRGPEEELNFEIRGPDRIRLLAPDGRPVAGERNYELTAGPEFRAFDPRLPLRGMLSYDADAARFTECLTGRDYPLLQDGDYAALEHAYLAAGAEPGGPIMASFDGGIVQPAEGEGEDGEPAVLVERFVGVWPGETCDRTVETASLTNTYWKILRLAETEVAAGEGRREPNLILRQDAPAFTATVGCNQITGSYALAGDTVSFGEVATTMMACEPPLDGWEAKLDALLRRTASYRIDGQTLELLDAAGASLGLFQAVYLY
jgi:copper homeostasis protein (lipoprotein)